MRHHHGLLNPINVGRGGVDIGAFCITLYGTCLEHTAAPLRNTMCTYGESFKPARSFVLVPVLQTHALKCHVCAVACNHFDAQRARELVPNVSRNTYLSGTGEVRATVSRCVCV